MIDRIRETTSKYKSVNSNNNSKKKKLRKQEKKDQATRLQMITSKRTNSAY